MALAKRKTGIAHPGQHIIISDDNDAETTGIEDNKGRLGTDPPAGFPVYRPNLPRRMAPAGATTGKEQKSLAVADLSLHDSTTRDALAGLESALRQNPAPALRVVLMNSIIAIAGKTYLDKIVESVTHDTLKHKSPKTPMSVPPKVENIKALFNDLSKGFERRISELETINLAYRQELANQVAPALNDRIQAMPHDTYEDKKALAKWVNEALRRFDLAIKCPKTGNPSLLVAGPGHHPEIGRFMLEHKTSEGKRVRPVLTPDLPRIELMEASPRREGLLEWQDKVKRHRPGSKNESRTPSG